MRHLKTFGLLCLVILAQNLQARTLYGDVFGKGKNNKVIQVGGMPAATIAAAAIANNNATSSDEPNTIVQRDSSGNFATNMITLNGTVTNATDATTKAYVDSVATFGLDPKDPALAIATTNVASLSGTTTIDGVALAANDRVLLQAQTDQIENGLWLVQAGAWTRPTDFADGTTAGTAYVLIQEGTTNAGTSWVCDSPDAIIGTDSITFVQFSLPVTADNVGAGTGDVFRDKTGTTLNLRTLAAAAGAHTSVVTSGDVINIGTDATSANIANKIVSRDFGGGFSAGTITADLNGTATNATTAVNFTGSLGGGGGDITGTQATCTVNTVGGATSSQISDAVIAYLDASSVGTPSTIVALDASSNFSANLITADLAGNADTATTAVTATNATNFTGSLVGDVTGTQGNTVVSKIASLSTNGVVHNDSSGILSTSLITNADLNDGIILANNIANSTITTTQISPTAAILGSQLDSSAGIVGTQLSPAADILGSQLSATAAILGSQLDSSAGIVGTQLSPAADILGSQLASSADIYAYQLASSAGIVGTQLSPAAGIVGGQIESGTTITANLIGTVTGSSSLNVLKAGDTMTGALALPAGTVSAPALNYSADGTSTGTGVYFPATHSLSLSTNGTERMNINSSGTVKIDGLNSAGVVHTDASGNLSTSLIVNADITNNTITGAKILAGTTITADLIGDVTGSISGTATNFTGSLVGDVTGTQGNTHVALVGGQTASDVAAATVAVNSELGAAGPGSYVAVVNSSGIIFADLQGDVTGAASLNVLKAGDTMTGALALPAGTVSAPALNYSADGTSTGTGVYFPATHSLSLSTNGTERMNINSSGTVKIDGLNSAGVVHTDASGNLSTSLIVNADVSGTAAIADTKLATISTAGKVANSATTATSSNNINTIVVRDGSGNFEAATITAALSGTATAAVFATTAGSATNFTGSLVGDVTGTQGNTHVALVGGQTASNVAAGSVLANAATNANTASAIVKRDSSGNFSAGTITASLTGAASSNVLKAGDTMSGALVLPAGSAGSPSLKFTGSTTTGLSAASDVLSLNAGGSTGLAVSSSNLTVNSLAGTAGVVHNDSSGVLSSGLVSNSDIANNSISGTKIDTATTVTATFVGDLTGNVTGSSTLNVLKAGDAMTGSLALPSTPTSAPALNFTGSITTGLSSPTTNALSLSTDGNERIKIDSSGIVTINNLSGVGGVVINSAAGILSSGLITNAYVANAAGIVDTKLATISTAGKVANSATTATNANTPSAIVARDSSGNFSAGTITATLSGSATNFTGSLVGDVTGTQGNTLVTLVGGQTASNVAAGSVLANAATNANTASAIVKRDSSGNFSAGTITASLTGAASSNVLKAGDTMSGALVLPAGSAAAPSLNFTGSTTTGLSAATANTLSFDTNGIEMMNINTATINFLKPWANRALQRLNTNTSTSLTINSTTSVLLINNTNNLSVTITLSLPSPINGQYITIANGSTNGVAIGLSYANESTSGDIYNKITTLSQGTIMSVTYYCDGASWYRL